MSWDYAELSKMAKENGGPEKLMEILVNSGKKKMIPWIGVAFAGGFALCASGQKIIKFFTKNDGQSDISVEVAKQDLIHGIKDYDAAQAAVDDIPACDCCGSSMTKFDEMEWYTCPHCDNRVRKNADESLT